MRKYISLIYLTMVYLFLLVPMLLVVISSFNSAIAFGSDFETFTFHWYRELFRHDEFANSMWISTKIGLIASILASLFGIPLSILLVRFDFRGKEIIDSFSNLPLIIPQVALSIAILQMFSLLKIRIDIITLILAHTVIIIPYVIRAVVSSMHFVDYSVEEAAMNLGANRFQTFLYITFPLIRSGVTAGFILSFIMSFINVPLSLFISSPMTTTLPIRIFAHMESRLDPIIAAVGSILIVSIFFVSIFLEKVLRIRLIL